MPLYEYQCEACDSRFEKIRQFSDPPLEICPKCGKGPVRKLLSSPAIQFKGSGFYITDYAKKSSPDSSSSESKRSDSEKSEKSEKGEKSEKSESKGKSEGKGDGASSSSTSSTSTSGDKKKD